MFFIFVSHISWIHNMKAINKISNQHSARNAEHYELYSSLLGLITEVLAVKYGLTAYRNRFAAAFAKENRAFANNLAYIQTEAVQKKRAAMNQQFRALNLTLQSKKLNGDAKVADAARTLTHIIKSYKGLWAKPQTEKLGMVKDLVNIFETEYAQEMATVEVTDLVADLKQAFGEFETVLYERANVQRARKEADSMTEVRPEVERTFEELAAVISALFIVASCVENDSAKAAELEELIDAMNARILQFQSALSRRGVGQAERVEEDEDEDSGAAAPTEETEAS